MATSMDLFRQLGAGAKFDLRRFKSDAEKFQVIRRTGKQLPQQDIIKALDIFGNSKRSSDETKENSKKKQKVSVGERSGTDNQDNLKGPGRPEKIKAIRKRNRIHVQGEDIPDPVETFEELQEEYGLHDDIIQNIMRVGYAAPTPIQMQAIPVLLHRRELLACAPTGSGKTAAFLLPILHQLKGPQKKGFRAVVVSPTRELSQQTYRELMRLSEGSGLRIHTIEHGAKAAQKFGPHTAQKFDILVTTPNRLVYLLQQDPPAIKLNHVEWLIIDESDKLFEEGKTGFRDQLGIIYQACDSSQVRRAMFSATFAYDVEQWCRLNLDNVVTVSIGARNTANDRIEQELIFVGSESGKLLAVRNLFSKGFTPPVLVFVQSKERAKELFQELIYDGYNVDVIHADKTQTQRDNIVKGFRAGKIWVLIATELMGRGIDFKGVNLVINYDFPTSAVSYIHRIGRTGRAGLKGRAVTFFTEDDAVHLRSIANVMRNAGCPVPDYMLQIRKLSKRKKKLVEKNPVRRDTIRTLPKDELRKAKRKT
ncbi:probable ATP-dependent RNA helicase DDX52 isoform X2 [Strongylocentrotus purpuratus]|uniref:Probable ATP-dependent RNA helicase DDX52 n=1 Tax=Strongylocentrotus purpuratus TaxID=7668 RepID=A0A7M7PBU1_STRPU|nr:probable ATP-dependent RNA helicase DDX52 isoform X2 [Strongylocentrotus purpuratus]